MTMADGRKKFAIIGVAGYIAPQASDCDAVIGV